MAENNYRGQNTVVIAKKLNPESKCTDKARLESCNSNGSHLAMCQSPNRENLKLSKCQASSGGEFDFWKLITIEIKWLRGKFQEGVGFWHLASH